MKKILFVTNHFRYENGVATVLRNLIDNLNPKEFEISLLAIYEFDSEFAKPIMDKIRIIPGFNLYFRGLDKLVNLIPPKILYKRFIRDKYDLEVAFQFGVPTKMIAVSPNPNKLCWMHGYDSDMLLRKYYKKYPKVINVARYGMNKMIMDGFEKEKCDYCYNIIDEKSILKLSEEESPIKKHHKYCVINISRLTPEKGFMRYLECIKEIVKVNRDVEFWIIGSGSEEEKMKHYISEHNLNDYVIMLGKQTNPFKFLKEADIYFCSSYREGFSTSCQEAALFGIPVVSVEVGGAKELCELSQCGLVIKNDANSIISELINILKDDKKINDWKKQANRTKTEFYKEKRIKRVEFILKAGMNDEYNK